MVTVALVLGLGAVGYTAYEDSRGRAVTFSVSLGDGYSWAGTAAIVYTVAGKAYKVQLAALPNGDHRKNTWRATKFVKPPVAVALSATPAWSGVPVVVVIRSQGVSARPVTAVGPSTAATAAFIAE